MSKWHGGKGSKQRTTDYETYTSNYDKIFNKKMKMKENIKWDVYSDEYECPNAVDLLEGDVIEWVNVAGGVEITIVEECFSVGEAGARGGSTFVVPARKFDAEYKPAFR